MGMVGGLNLNQYVKNPIQWVDSLGLTPWSSIPMLNGALPGNQSAYGKAVAYSEELTKCGKCGCGTNEDFWNENRLQFVADIGLPNTREGWVNYLNHASAVFGGIATVTGAALQPAIAIPSGVIAAAANAGSKILMPPPSLSLMSDAAIDILGDAIPSSGLAAIGKDVALSFYKEMIAKEAEKTMAKPISSDQCK